jgi:hypothetical protein
MPTCQSIMIATIRCNNSLFAGIPFVLRAGWPHTLHRFSYDSALINVSTSCWRYVTKVSLLPSFLVRSHYCIRGVGCLHHDVHSVSALLKHLISATGCPFQGSDSLLFCCRGSCYSHHVSDVFCGNDSATALYLYCICSLCP